MQQYQDNWQQWKWHYREQLQHPAGYEEMFVDSVLSRVKGITPSDVIPQYHFKDSNGKNRYIDFLISNKQKGIHLAIELDGLTKLHNVNGSLDYNSYNDLWQRQNDLVTQVGKLFRFTNKQMFNETALVIAKIESELTRQANVALQQQKQMLSYQNQMAMLKQQNTELKSANEQNHQVMQMIRQLQAKIDELSQEQAKYQSNQVDKSENELPRMPEVQMLQNVPVMPSTADLTNQSNDEPANNLTVTKPSNKSNRKWFVLFAVGIAALVYVISRNIDTTNNDYVSSNNTYQNHYDSGSYESVATNDDTSNLANQNTSNTSVSATTNHQSAQSEYHSNSAENQYQSNASERMSDRVLANQDHSSSISDGMTEYRSEQSGGYAKKSSGVVRVERAD